MNSYDIVKIESYVKGEKSMDLKINSSTVEILKIIETIRNEMEKCVPNFLKLKHNCFKLIRRLPLPIHILHDSFILRSQENFNGEIFHTASRLSYNPSPKFPGRFNLTNESVFYGAAPITSHDVSGQLTSICETCKELFNTNSEFSTKYFTIGKFNIVKPINVVMLTFHRNAEQKSFHLRNINPSYRDFLSLSCSQEDYFKCLNFFSLFSEYAAQLCYDTNKYLLTTAFLHSLKEYYGKEIGILYSSSMTDNKGLNIALTKEVIDEKYLKFDLAVMYKSIRDPSDLKSNTIFPCTEIASVSDDGSLDFKKNDWY